jgi:hypothetical protein
MKFEIRNSKFNSSVQRYDGIAYLDKLKLRSAERLFARYFPMKDVAKM